MKDKNRLEQLKELMDEIEYPRADELSPYISKDELLALLAWVKSMKAGGKHGSDKRV